MDEEGEYKVGTGEEKASTRIMENTSAGIAAASSEFERSMIQQCVHAGLQRARKAGKVLGRPKVDERTEAAIRDALKNGIGIKKTAKLLGCGIATVYRIKTEAELAAE
jgi:DNA invertase Pin-like site-specific DNA recombinase